MATKRKTKIVSSEDTRRTPINAEGVVGLISTAAVRNRPLSLTGHEMNIEL